MNRVILLGRLGKDPEQGNNNCRFSLATTEKWKRKDSSIVDEKTEWHNITVFGRQAENCLQYIRKGSKILLEGKISYYKKEEGTESRTFTNIIADKITFLDSKQTEI